VDLGIFVCVLCLMGLTGIDGMNSKYTGKSSVVSFTRKSQFIIFILNGESNFAMAA